MSSNNLELINRIGAEQVRSAYRNTAPGMMATLVGALLIVGILGGSGAVSPMVAAVFAGVMLAQIGVRLTLIFTYSRRKPPDEEWRTWSRRFAAGALFASLFLGECYGTA